MVLTHYLNLGTNLENVGFIDISSKSQNSDVSSMIANSKVGDIIVFPSTKRFSSGHIQMRTDKGWVSDISQDYSNPSSRVYSGDVSTSGVKQYRLNSSSHYKTPPNLEQLKKDFQVETGKGGQSKDAKQSKDVKQSKYDRDYNQLKQNTGFKIGNIVGFSLGEAVGDMIEGKKSAGEIAVGVVVNTKNRNSS